MCSRGQGSYYLTQMKDPAFLFYPNDWIGGTMGMTFEEKGAYMELLILQFNRGHMTTHMIGHVLGQTGGHLWDKLVDKFEVDADGNYFNSRLDAEKTKRKNYSNSRKNNKLGKNQYSKKAEAESGHMTTHMIGHMGNEDEDVIINKSQVGKEGVGEKPNPEPPASEIPSLDAFLAHAKSFNDPVDEAKAIAMYEKWKKNGWNDSKGNPIKNWTALLKFNIPDLKPNGKKNQQNNTSFRTNR